MELTQEHFDQIVQGLATKNNLDGLATKADLLELATQQDLNSLKRDVTEIKAMVQRIDKRDLEDSNAFAKDLLDLKKRVKSLERHSKLTA
jgi:hypothetical protein